MAKVTIYSTPTCVYCKMAKEFFAKNNVAYEEHDVASDMKAREEMVNKSHQLGVPVIDIDNNIVVGFDQKTIEGLLGLGKAVAPAA
jgi:glutaredoxin-like YruB-family protein